MLAATSGRARAGLCLGCLIDFLHVRRGASQLYPHSDTHIGPVYFFRRGTAYRGDIAPLRRRASILGRRSLPEICTAIRCTVLSCGSRAASHTQHSSSIRGFAVSHPT
ncbi:hypothetical protein HYPSUDRAFT_445066 [Hypholoma sublateritium FD-334 SS-4]|uniref:Uncharacterized protein n=1 Tax=Hypholoma sublateritium (strain FD-334 SS-4) TaxID=945553 RepID=A0A0D2KIJ1_HYPSF|nr:hypothetical protein HYPSUDRAFT_445066 [Hypholoma sublateritium FD-334 SS-4]